MPVYNGERFIARAIEAVLGQTYKDLTLIISDNASTDGTQAICEAYVRRDPRVRYLRYEENRGAAWNFSNTFHEARSPYFKWQCVDDSMAPAMVEQCVAALDREPGVVLAYHKATIIDANDETLSLWEDNLDLRQPRPHQRLHHVLYKRNKGHLESQFGVYRASVLARTGLIGAVPHSDQILIAEMALHGEFRELPEHLFMRRFHEGISTEAHSLHDLGTFLDPRRKNKVTLLRAERLLEFARAIGRADLPLGERLRCYAELRSLVLSTQNIARIIEDITVAGKTALRAAGGKRA
jgi:glycosyltransferase involved in cell wall biosynthesis